MTETQNEIINMIKSTYDCDNKQIRNKAIDDLRSCTDRLKTCDYKYVKQYINACPKDKNELIEAFKNDFRDIPNDDKLKIDTLEFLGILGISINEYRLD